MREVEFVGGGTIHLCGVLPSGAEGGQMIGDSLSDSSAYCGQSNWTLHLLTLFIADNTGVGGEGDPIPM